MADSQITNPTVFVVDDDALARDSVCALVESMGRACEAFASAEQFLGTIQTSAVGCVLTDVRMPGLSGLDLQQKLHEKGVRLPVIVLSAFPNTRATVRAMKQGAVTFLTKPCDQHELYEAIREALQLDQDNRQAASAKRKTAERLALLTLEERQVLHLILDGMSNKATAIALDVSLRTVESRRQNIFTKMQADSVAQLVRIVFNVNSEFDFLHKSRE